MSTGSSNVEPLPQDVEQFIVAYIRSVDMLEMLLLIHNQPARSWSAQEIGIELRTNTEAGQIGLTRLCALNLVVRDGDRFRYQPATKEIGDVVTRLGELYARRRVAIITCIYGKRDTNIRAFADAFRLSNSPPKEDANP